MLIGVVFAGLAALCGVAVVRLLRGPIELAPLTGLASIAILTTWATAAGLPPAIRMAGVGCLALVGLVFATRAARQGIAVIRRNRLSTAVMVLAVTLPMLMLGAAFSSLEAPVSTHDGAFHVETIESLRDGLRVQTWYPMGFHTSVAAVLGLFPSVDTATGTFQAAQGLAILAPLAVFSLGLTLGLKAPVASVSAAILGLTWTYPYDYHLWAGWPQGMGILLLIGLSATAAHWIREPAARTALLGGVFAGAVLLCHGTEVYSSVFVLGAMALVCRRSLALGKLAISLPLAAGVAVLVSAPYVPTLLGWAGGGGATSAGEAVGGTPAAMDGGGDLLQFVLGVTGAASLIDLPVRAFLVALGMKAPRARVPAAIWLTVVGLLVVVDYVNLAPVRSVFAVTYPWLDHDRPRQVAVVFASLLAAVGIWVCLGYLARARMQWAAHPNAWRRAAIACALVLFFVAEGSGVSVYKRLIQAVTQQNVYSADDAAAMHWLSQHAAPGDLVGNDLAGDAGIWAPYKAHVPILLPRLASGPIVDAREPILRNVTDLNRDPGLLGEACALHLKYLFHGSPPLAFDERLLRDRSTLERAPDLEEVFASGEATVFRVKLACD